MSEAMVGPVVVVDDKPDEGLPIVNAFWRIGMGACYYTGKSDELPSQPRAGIRLLILDMDLGDVPSDDANAALSKLLLVIGSIVALDNGPYVIVLWSQFPFLKEEFKALFSEMPAPNSQVTSIPYPSFIVDLPKERLLKRRRVSRSHASLTTSTVKQNAEASSISDAARQDAETKDKQAEDAFRFVVLSSAFNVKRFWKELKAGLGEAQPLDLLLDWERRVKHAACGALCSLSQISLEVSAKGSFPPDVSSSPIIRWQYTMNRMLAALLHENADPSLSDSTEAVKAASMSLNPLLFDKVENSFEGVRSEIPNAGRKLMDVDVNAKNELEFRSGFRGRINAAILLDLKSSVHARPRPGNLYTYDEVRRRGVGKRFSSPFPSLEDVKKDTFSSSDGCSGKPTLEPRPCFLEVSPACDHVQGRMKQVRLVAGFFIPNIMNWLKADAAFLNVIGPFALPDCPWSSEGHDTCLALNAHYTVSLNKSALDPAGVLCRLRSECLASVQTWLGSHMSRQGYVCLDPSRLPPRR